VSAVALCGRLLLPAKHSVLLLRLLTPALLVKSLNDCNVLYDVAAGCPPLQTRQARAARASRLARLTEKQRAAYSHGRLLLALFAEEDSRQPHHTARWLVLNVRSWRLFVGAAAPTPTHLDDAVGCCRDTRPQVGALLCHGAGDGRACVAEAAAAPWRRQQQQQKHRDVRRVCVCVRTGREPHSCLRSTFTQASER
jgi:hypothetical protein